MTKINQAKKELKIFQGFLKHHPVKSSVKNFQKKDPPYPDIECDLVNGQKLSFELLESVDNRIRKKWSNYIKLRELLKKEIEGLSEKEKFEFHKKYHGCTILIDFKDEYALRKNKKILKEVIKYILNSKKLDSNYFNREHFEELNNIEIIKNNYENEFPDIDLPGICTDFEETSIEMIRKKFNKKYRYYNRIELIVFYDYQFDICDLGKEKLLATISFIKDNICSSPFKNVWLYSYTNDWVIYN
ncbi:MAG: hypothetical protein R6V04_15585 [bacterium]